MKKIIKSAFVLAIMALAFTSCEDVPAPFDTNYHEGGATKVEPAGDGTEASPYNVARVLEIIKAGEQTSDMVYIKGIITNVKEIDTNQFGNATFSISDTKGGKTTFLIYRSFGLNGQKFKTGNEIAVNDTVVVYGELTNYNGTFETKQGAKIVSINGNKGDNTGGNTGGENTTKPAGEGTEASPYNVAKALELTKALPKDGTSENDVYVAGTIVGTPSIDTGSFGNATYEIADEGSSTPSFKIFRGYAFNGDKFTAADQLKEGDKVVVCGKLLNYFGNTPEMAQGNKLISVNGKTEFENTGGESGGDDKNVTISGTTVTILNSAVTAGETTATIDLNTIGQENATDATTYSLSDGSTITFGAGSNTTNSPKFYSATKGVRLYANNTIAFAGKAKIAKIVFTCDSYNGTNYVGNATQTVVFDGNNATYTNSHSENKGGVQLRVQTITITYAK